MFFLIFYGFFSAVGIPHPTAPAPYHLRTPSDKKPLNNR